MKSKIDLLCVLTVVVGTYLGSLFLAYWLNEFLAFLAIYDLSYFKEMTPDDLNTAEVIIWEICMFVCFTVSNMFLYLLQKRRKNNFLKKTRGLIRKKESFIWHFENNCLTEAAIFFALSLVSVISFFANEHFCPLAIIYTCFGSFWGIFLNLLIIPFFQVLHIIFSQYRWRIDYYKHE